LQYAFIEFDKKEEAEAVSTSREIGGVQRDSVGLIKVVL